MADKVNGIEDLEELKAAAATQGAAIPNYNEWNQILKELDQLGVESTGSYSGDKVKIQEVQQAVEEYIKEVQIEQVANENKKENQQIKDLTEKDSEQTVKANVANATSSQLMAEYMRIFHLLP